MLHKLLAGHRSHIRRVLSVMLCLALICGTVASMSVFAAEPETETELVTETMTDVTGASEQDMEVAAEVLASSEEQTTEVVSELVTEGITETETDDEISSEEVSETTTESTTEEQSETGNGDAIEETSETEMPAVTLTGSADGVSVSVNAPEGAFAEGVTMVVSEVDVDAFEAAVLADCGALGDSYTAYDAAAVNISFYDADGIKVQPATEVEVTLSGLNLATKNENGEAEYALIYHMNDDGSVEWVEDQDPGQESYTFTASSFSTYGVVNVSVEYGIELTASGTIKVYYDTITKGTSSITALNSETGISSVTISGGSATNNGSVAHADGTQRTSNSWTATTASITRNNTSNATVTITITPSAGYYVTYVTVCCTTSGAPTSCITYSEGDAFVGSYSIENMGTISIDVPLNEEAGFYHNGGTSPYFILIAVAKIPSPLYVEYEYGTIVDSLSADGYDYSAFNTASGWTSTAGGNSYGTTGSGESSTNGVMTDATQYKYTYADNSDSSSAGWAHYANSITDEAIAQAAADGYYFAGWQATYYTTCDVTDTSGSYNNYYYDFSSQYGTSSDYFQPGASVPLTVHVKLVAIWVKPTVKPGSLTIEKTFSGLPEGTTVDSITFTVTKDGDSSFEERTVTLSNSNSWSQTINNLSAGTYTVTETGYEVDGYSCTTTVNGTEVEGGSASVTLTGTLSSTYNSSTGLYEYTAEVGDATVEFVNTYVVDTAKLILKKEIEGNAAVTTKKFTFTVSYTNSGGESITEIYDLADGDSNESNPLEVKLGTTVTILEASDGYTATATLNGSEIAVTETSGNSSLTFEINEDSTVVVTNTYNVYPDTGVNLDSVPYIALLCGVVVLGAVVLIRRRRKLL